MLPQHTDTNQGKSVTVKKQPKYRHSRNTEQPGHNSLPQLNSPLQTESFYNENMTQVSQLRAELPSKALAR